MQALTSNYCNDQISIYIHFPWCIKKCPYCDFNSYTYNKNISEQNYIEKILIDFDASLKFLLDINVNKKKISSIFFGGGTPSLLSGKAIYKILNHINKQIHFAKNVEITLEVNPGAVEQDSMQNYYNSGINRVSLGVQSFQNEKLQALGRIHNVDDIKMTIQNIINTNFSNFNLDIMYGLPNQSIDDAMYDLQQALSFEPSHVSWYQLTLEPDTAFYHKPPKLPIDNIVWDIMQHGLNILKQYHYSNYEVSAFCKENYHCRHNLNYWQYGDYLGIGPGAHSKITSITKNNYNIHRLIKPKSPKSYFNSEFNFDNLMSGKRLLEPKEIIFEFMLNNLRLTQGFLKEDFKCKTSLDIACISDIIDSAVKKDLLKITKDRIKTTSLGRTFLNDLLELFI